MDEMVVEAGAVVMSMKVRLDRIQKRLDELERAREDEIRGRIVRLQFDPDEVLSQFPPSKKAARERLMIALEYEELVAEHPLALITEGHYACGIYPAVVIQYLHYLLNEGHVPPVEEIDLISFP